jgi:hypothetical protein
MTPVPDTPATTLLAGIRERSRWTSSAEGIAAPGATAEKSARDVPRLLAAVEAVLKPHQPGRIVVRGTLCKRHENHRYFSITGTEAADVRACQECKATVFNSCAGCGHPVPLDACPVREAITAALTGEEAGRG